MRASIAVVLLILLSTACATTRPMALDPVNLTVSESSRIVSSDLIPDATHSPRVVNHLALAEELYQRKLALLHERRDAVRSRTRTLHALSFATFAGTALGVGALSISAAQKEPSASGDALRQTGYVALSGLAAGTLLEVLGYMQEDPASIDAKAQRLQAAHAHMLERIRTLAAGATPAKEPGANLGVETLMAGAIEAFMAEAAQINVQG